MWQPLATSPWFYSLSTVYIGLLPFQAGHLMPEDSEDPVPGDSEKHLRETRDPGEFTLVAQKQLMVGVG